MGVKGLFSSEEINMQDAKSFCLSRSITVARFYCHIDFGRFLLCGANYFTIYITLFIAACAMEIALKRLTEHDKIDRNSLITECDIVLVAFTLLLLTFVLFVSVYASCNLQMFS